MHAANPSPFKSQDKRQHQDVSLRPCPIWNIKGVWSLCCHGCSLWVNVSEYVLGSVFWQVIWHISLYCSRMASKWLCGSRWLTYPLRCLLEMPTPPMGLGSLLNFFWLWLPATQPRQKTSSRLASGITHKNRELLARIPWQTYPGARRHHPLDDRCGCFRGPIEGHWGKGREAEIPATSPVLCSNR